MKGFPYIFEVMFEKGPNSSKSMSPWKQQFLDGDDGDKGEENVK